ncbi:hypothetical protein [Geminocystis sp. NIES-3709]|uniref:hypothetical protein n=1 Tax=Geminocystis sp. NIES-3709 TaxID=1617448 RepID=UPI0005FCCE89|nr:hypothetical protein [Geminocystis sp. NIES-3709]BAQ65380.1 hypothetical protein GM3709_2145 [Geminocystis sp. NIES-3709]
MIKNILLMGLLSFNLGLNIPVFAMDEKIEKLSPTLNKEEGWSIWHPWIYFPFDKIQVGISNMDLGGMLDFEYSCFGSVGEENNKIKQETYWYRISEKVEKIDQEKYVQIEVGCWLNNNFKSTIILTGIKN